MARMPGCQGALGQQSLMAVPHLLHCALGENLGAPGEADISLAFFMELKLLQVCTLVSKALRAARCLQLTGLPSANCS